MTDTGIGMTREQMDGLFKPFSKVRVSVAAASCACLVNSVRSPAPNSCNYSYFSVGFMGQTPGKCLNAPR